jgi:hypothetical protein
MLQNGVVSTTRGENGDHWTHAGGNRPSAFDGYTVYMLSTKHTSPLLRYGVAMLAVGVVFGLKLLLDPLIAQDVPFLLVFGAIMISAWYGGLGSGLLATVASGLTADSFFYPKGPFSGFSPETEPLIVFFLEGTLVCLLTEALRVAEVDLPTKREDPDHAE